MYCSKMYLENHTGRWHSSRERQLGGSTTMWSFEWFGRGSLFLCTSKGKDSKLSPV